MIRNKKSYLGHINPSLNVNDVDPTSSSFSSSGFCVSARVVDSSIVSGRVVEFVSGRVVEFVSGRVVEFVSGRVVESVSGRVVEFVSGRVVDSSIVSAIVVDSSLSSIVFAIVVDSSLSSVVSGRVTDSSLTSIVSGRMTNSSIVSGTSRLAVGFPRLLGTHTRIMRINGATDNNPLGLIVIFVVNRASYWVTVNVFTAWQIL